MRLAFELYNLDFSSFLTLCDFFFAVRYPTDPLSKHHHFGHEGWPGKNFYFSLHQTMHVFTDKDKERNARLKRCSSLILREIISDGKFESKDKKLIRKSMFFFMDSIDINNNDLFYGNYKWLRQISN